MANKVDNQANDPKNTAGKGNGMSPDRVKGIRNFIIYIAGLILLVFLIIQFVAIWTKVSGDSMQNTLSSGDSIIVEKVSYHFSDPERFDIVVFPFKEDDNTYYYVKRVIALPGETVRIDEEGTIYVNGEALAEDFGNETISADRLGLAAEEITLAEDEYFVLGDNRNNSSDSRDPNVGNVSREDIIGRVWIRFYPFNKFGSVSQ